MSKLLRDFDHSLFGISRDSSLRNYSYGELTYVRNSNPMFALTPRGVPLRAANFRIIRVLRGNAIFNMNLIDYEMKPNCIMITPPNTIGCLVEFDEDFSDEVIDLPSYITQLAGNDHGTLPLEVIYLFPSSEDSVRIALMFDLLEQYVLVGLRNEDRQRPWMDSINHLLLTLVYDLCQLNLQQLNQMSKKTRNTDVFRQFQRLLNEHGSKERSLRFYANQLNLSIPHFRSIILEQSGKSALEWIYQTTVMEAKMLLCHTDLRVFEIADHLHFSETSAFVRFFRNHAGISPGAYRKENAWNEHKSQN